MRLLLLVLSLLAVSCSGLFFKKNRLFGGDSDERGGFGGLFGRGKRSRGRGGCYRPPTASPCYNRPIPVPRPPKIICGYAPSGYGGQGYSGSGGYGGHAGHVGHVGQVGHVGHTGGYQTIGFKGSAPIKGFNSISSRELQVGGGKFQVSQRPSSFGSTGFSKTPVGSHTIKLPSNHGTSGLSGVGLGGTSFSGYNTGYGGPDGKVKISNFHSSFED